jgi:hypothetical protein
MNLFDSSLFHCFTESCHCDNNPNKARISKKSDSWENYYDKAFLFITSHLLIEQGCNSKLYA